MGLPYVISEEVWNAQVVTNTKELLGEFERCQVVIIEITTTGFSGTIDIQGKVQELSAYSNIPYIRQDQAALQVPAVDQLSYDTDTGVYRYAVLGYWRRIKIVMTRSAGSITCGAAGSSNAINFIVTDPQIATIEEATFIVQNHNHNHEKWMGVAASPSGETHKADRLGPGIAAFALLSDNDAYGSWVQILGSSDTPIQAGKTQMDAHRVLVTTTNSTEAFVVQFAFGESAGLAALIAAEDMTEFAYISATNNADSGISEIRTKRIASGTKIWARAICIGQTAKTINLYIGVHEYER